MASLEEAKQILKRETNNRSVYDHLSEVLLKVLVDKPADALDGFEHISASIKRLALAPKPVPDYADDVDDAQTTRITVSGAGQSVARRWLGGKLKDSHGPPVADTTDMRHRVARQKTKQLQWAKASSALLKVSGRPLPVSPPGGGGVVQTHSSLLPLPPRLTEAR